MLELQSINKRLGSMELSEVSFEINQGQCCVLLGPSGVGKTVLVEIIAGLIRPDGGRILWQGRDITFDPPETRGFAVVYQDYALFPHLTVAQNIAYGLRAAGAKSGKIRDRLQNIAGMLDIQELLNRRPGTLSGGEQQRVALARALAMEPGLLLLDEPLSALDTNTRIKLREELKRINTELNTPILHVTHDPEEAMILADRICVMLDGRIRQIAVPEDLFRRPSDPDVAQFLGMKNVLPVTAVDKNVCLACGQKIHVSSADESISHIWIKPEEILLSQKPFESSARNQFRCITAEWSHRGSLLAVRAICGELSLTALVTYASFKELQIEPGGQVYATFKSSAVHCF